MIEHTLDAENSILHVRPKSSLQQSDFAELAKAVDPYISETGGLAGLIIETSTFPGWENLGAMAAHFRFVRDHHKHIKRIGLVTDSALRKGRGAIGVALRVSRDQALFGRRARGCKTMGDEPAMIAGAGPIDDVA